MTREARAGTYSFNLDSFSLEVEEMIASPSRLRKKRSTKQSNLLQRRKEFLALSINTDDSVKSGENMELLRYKHGYFAANRPEVWQANAFEKLRRVLRGIKREKLKISLINVSSASLVSKIRSYNKKKNKRHQIHVSVCSPHLWFHSGQVRDKGTEFKSGQPLREKFNRKTLLSHIRLKSIDCVASGHLYVPKEFKRVDEGCFIKSFNGIKNLKKKAIAALGIIYKWCGLGLCSKN